ncbi:GNAT family N-acetyltransferase [Actinomadura madurae]|uniref:GNAT family N-acetyltransferase n=1 Tax=Actinomadura madurae TaxID=1993 RepID=UPI0035568E1E
MSVTTGEGEGDDPARRTTGRRAAAGSALAGGLARRPRRPCAGRADGGPRAGALRGPCGEVRAVDGRRGRRGGPAARADHPRGRRRRGRPAGRRPVRPRRGRVGGALLRAAEERFSGRHSEAWLAVVPGNTRARRFYEFHGWRDTGPMTYSAPTATGRVDVPVHRYVKPLG